MKCRRAASARVALSSAVSVPVTTQRLASLTLAGSALLYAVLALLLGVSATASWNETSYGLDDQIYMWPELWRDVASLTLFCSATALGQFVGLLPFRTRLEIRFRTTATIAISSVFLVMSAALSMPAPRGVDETSVLSKVVIAAIVPAISSALLAAVYGWIRCRGWRADKSLERSRAG